MSECLFVDASFWIALRDPRDQRHQIARTIILHLGPLRPQLVSTLLVAAETHAYVSRNPKIRAQVLDDIQISRAFRIAEVSLADHDRAFIYLRQCADKTYSLCDAISHAIMRRLEIRRVLTFDDHFTQMGCFTVIDRPDPPLSDHG
jgi:uncharacterized protein